MLSEGTSATPTKNAPCCNRGGKTGSSQANLEAFEVRAVNDACTSSARRNPRLAEDCRQACNARSCCFIINPGNCSSRREESEEWCDKFSAWLTHIGHVYNR